MRRIIRAFAWTAAIILALMIGGALISDGTPPRPAAPADPNSGLRLACREAIKSVLHDPGSAEWIDRYTWPVSAEGDEATVHAELRARNALGALILTRFECRLRHEGDDIRALWARELR
jgi:hypothetical protein